MHADTQADSSRDNRGRAGGWESTADGGRRDWLAHPVDGGCRLVGCVVCRMYQLPAEEDERIKARVEASQARRQEQVGRHIHRPRSQSQ